MLFLSKMKVIVNSYNVWKCKKCHKIVNYWKPVYMLSIKS
jgi:hypothetical protein